MTEQEIIEGHKLIAILDGWKLKGEPEYTKPYSIFEKYFDDSGYPKQIPFTNPNGEVYEDFTKLMKYHTSWDWLMPAWYKFRGLSLPYELCHLHANYCARISQQIAYGTIANVYPVLVNAIKWYNQQKTNP
jgi:hypothetical protein